MVSLRLSKPAIPIALRVSSQLTVDVAFFADYPRRNSLAPPPRTKLSSLLPKSQTQSRSLQKPDEQMESSRKAETLAPLYNVLDATLQEVRVLHVAPGTGDSVVSCSLKHISLLHDSVPSYESVSYCWGTPRTASYIDLNGRAISVPANSGSAIRRMRLEHEPRVLWIDAICINQSSPNERSQQVSLMSTVYSQATRNLVYLGEDIDGLAKRALQCVSQIVNEIRITSKDLTSLAGTTYDPDTGALFLSQEDFTFDVDFEALEGLFRQPWFTWVSNPRSLFSVS